MNSRTVLVLVLLFLAGFLARTLFLPENLFFGFEQGRDALVVKEILGGKLTLLGPKTDIEGLFHGPLFYYLIAIPYFFGQGSPVVVSFFLIFLSSLGIPLIYFLAKSLFNHRVGILAAIFYTFSYGSIVFSRWLANPVLAPVFVMLLVLSLVEIKKDQRYLLLLAVSLAAIIHFEVVAAIFLLPAVVIYWWWERLPKPGIKYLSLSFLLFLVLLSSYPLFEIRHNFLQTTALVSFLVSLKQEGIGNPDDLIKVLHLYFDEFTLFLTPFLSLGVILLLLAFVLLRQRLLFLWLLTTPLIMLIFSRFALSHLFLALGPAFIILTAYLVDFLLRKNLPVLGWSLTILVLIINLVALFAFLPQNRGVFFQAGQRLFKYGDMLRTVDYIYQEAKGEKFSIHPFTIPYFSDHGWRYLFLWYGRKKYGYLPAEVGSRTFYTIYQPSEGQPWFLSSWLNKEEDQGKLIKKRQFGVITIEKREVR